MATSNNKLNVILKLKGASAFKAQMSGVAGSTSKMRASLSGISKMQIGMVFMQAIPYIMKFGRAITDATKDMDTGIRNVGTLIEDFNEKTYAGLEKTLSKMKQLPATNKEILAGTYEYVSAGGKLNDVHRDMTTYTKSSAAGLATVKEATDLGTTVLNAYGLSYKETKKVMDKFFLAVKYGKTTIGKMGQTIGQVANVAATYKVPVDMLTSSIAMLTKKGIQTPAAMRGLRQGIIALMTPSEEYAERMKEMGVQGDTFQEKLKSIKEAGLTPADWKKIVPSVRASNALMTLVNGYDELSIVQKKMKTEAPGAMDKAYATQIKSTANQMKLMKKQVTALAVAMGKDLIPAMLTLFKTGSAVLKPGTLLWFLQSAILGVPRFVNALTKAREAKEKLMQADSSASAMQQKQMQIGRQVIAQHKKGHKFFKSKAVEQSALEVYSQVLAKKGLEAKRNVAAAEKQWHATGSKQDAQRVASTRKMLAANQGLQKEVIVTQGKLHGMSDVDFSGLSGGLHDTSAEALMAAYKVDFLAGRLQNIPKDILVKIRIQVTEEVTRTSIGGGVDPSADGGVGFGAGGPTETTTKKDRDKPPGGSRRKRSKDTGGGAPGGTGGSQQEQYITIPERIAAALGLLKAKRDAANAAGLKSLEIDAAILMKKAALLSAIDEEIIKQEKVSAYTPEEEKAKAALLTALYQQKATLLKEDNTLQKEMQENFKNDMQELDSTYKDNETEGLLAHLESMKGINQANYDEGYVSKKDYEENKTRIQKKEEKAREKQAKAAAAKRKKFEDGVTKYAMQAADIGAAFAIAGQKKTAHEKQAAQRQAAVMAINMAGTVAMAETMKHIPFPFNILPGAAVKILFALMASKAGSLPIAPAAAGGLINKPTLTLLGEAGPELVLPLGGLGTPAGELAGNDTLRSLGAGGGGSMEPVVNINITQVNPIGENAGQALAEVIDKYKEDVASAIKEAYDA